MIIEFISVPVRLNGSGSSTTEGFIEALGTDNQWGFVCDNGFDLFDAHVVCKMLGFPTAIESLVNGAAANFYGTVWSGSNFTLNNLECTGAETSVFDCPLTGELKENCEASEISGVKCAMSKF